MGNPGLHRSVVLWMSKSISIFVAGIAGACTGGCIGFIGGMTHFFAWEMAGFALAIVAAFGGAVAGALGGATRRMKVGVCFGALGVGSLWTFLCLLSGNFSGNTAGQPFTAAFAGVIVAAIAGAIAGGVGVAVGRDICGGSGHQSRDHRI